MSQGDFSSAASRIRPLDFHHENFDRALVRCSGCGSPIDAWPTNADDAGQPVCSDRCGQVSHSRLQP